MTTCGTLASVIAEGQWTTTCGPLFACMDARAMRVCAQSTTREESTTVTTDSAPTQEVVRAGVM